MSRFKVDSALRPSSGLYQKARGHTWYVKRSVPRDLQARLGGAFVRSTGTSDLRTAMLRRDEFYREWDELFARTRALGAGPDVTFEHLAAAVNAWKQKRCRFALAGPMHKRLWNIIDAIEGEIPDDHFEVLLDEQRLENAYAAGELPPSREQLSAQEYYEAHPEASRSLKTPFAVETLIRRLQDAAIHADDWRLVEGFDAALDQALLNGGIERPAPSELRPKLRLAFAAAWADVVQHEEMERLRAALQVAADAMTARTPDSLRLAPPVSEAAPPRTSKTVAQGIEHLRQVREVKGHGEADWKKLAAAYTTMIEIFGADRLLSTVEDTDAVAAVAMIQKVPWNQTKFWPGLPLADAIVAAEKVKARRLAPNTVNNYIVRMGQVFTALKLANPFAGLMTEGKKRVKRRAFTTAELKVIFESIVADRGDHAYYWLSALALYMGGRQNEFAQLYVADVKTYEGQRYLDLTLFDEDGLRSADKSLKTVESERVLPIHPALVEAGFLGLVERRRRQGEPRLFPELTWSESGGYAHAFSRWFNRHIDGLGLTSESLNFHAFRHGWTDAARRAHIPERNADLLGGWKAARGQAADYGNLQELTVNLEHLSTIAFGDFRLPRVTPGLSHPVRRGPRPRRAKGALVSEFRSA